MPIWDRYLTDEDRAVVAKGRFAKRMGFGRQPAMLVIDMQRYMVGLAGEDHLWPASCGENGRLAATAAASLVAVAQSKGVPCIFTRVEVDPSGRDIGVYGLKRDLLESPNWFLAGTVGAELIPALNPGPRDLVFVKKKPSAFHGTPLTGYLIDRGVDTVIVVGGATSNCVRATVFDAASYNFRAIVPAEAVFDRIPISHAISLFDMDRQFADVVSAAETRAYLERYDATAERRLGP